MVDPLPAGSTLLAEDVAPWSTGINNSLQPVLFQARQTVAQSIPNNAFTGFTFSAAEDIDTAGGHSLVTNNSRYVAQVSGWYELSGKVSFAANATGGRGVGYLKNGTLVPGSQVFIPAVAAVARQYPGVSMLVQLDAGAGDYVELGGFQDSGGALSTDVGAAQSQPIFVVRLVYRT